MAGEIIDKPTIVNMALVDLGHPPAYSTDDETTLGGTVDRAWQLCVDHCAGLHDWTDFRRTTRLAPHSATPENGWTYGFDLPGDRLGPPLKVLRSAGACEDPLRDYALEGGSLYANEPAVWARCKVYRDPKYWDGAWRAAFVKALASYLAVPLQQDFEARAEYWRVAFGSPSERGVGGMFGRLIAQDRAASPVASPMHRQDPLTLAHGGGSLW